MGLLYRVFNMPQTIEDMIDIHYKKGSKETAKIEVSVELMVGSILVAHVTELKIYKK